MSWPRMSVALIWFVALAAAAVIVTVVPSESVLPALAQALAGLLLLSFLVQFTVHPIDGLVGRLAAGVGGALVILVLAGVLALLIGRIDTEHLIIALPWR